MKLQFLEVKEMQFASFQQEAKLIHHLIDVCFADCEGLEIGKSVLLMSKDIFQGGGEGAHLLKARLNLDQNESSKLDSRYYQWPNTPQLREEED